MWIGGFAGELVVAVTCVCDEVDAVVLLGVDNTSGLNGTALFFPHLQESLRFCLAVQHSLSVIKNQMKEQWGKSWQMLIENARCNLQRGSFWSEKWEMSWAAELMDWSCLLPFDGGGKFLFHHEAKIKNNVITAHFARCSVGKGKRGARKGEERDSRGTENLGLSLPSMFQEWNRTSAWTGKTLREIPDQLGHNSYHRDYILYLWNKQVSSNLRGPGICLHKAR